MNIYSLYEYKNHIPDRLGLLNKELYNKLNAEIKTGADIYFLPTYVQEISYQEHKYAKAIYKIILMGILEDGRRINVMLDGINPYFEVILNVDDKEKIKTTDYQSLISTDKNGIELNEEEKLCLSEIQYILENKLVEKKHGPIKYELFKSRPFILYRGREYTFLRIYYNKLKSRTEGINLMMASLFAKQTTHDDLSCYYRVVCRDYTTSFSSWCLLKNYNKPVNLDQYKDPVIRIDIKDYVAVENVPVRLKKDKTLCLSWDIETYREVDTGEPPMWHDPEHKIICLSVILNWASDKNPILRICLVDFPTNPHPDYITIVCGNEFNILRMFAVLVDRFRPEIITAFNDGQYDWPWVIERARQTKGLYKYMYEKFDASIPVSDYDKDKTEDVLYRAFKKENVKIEAGIDAPGQWLFVPGFIPIDTRIIFRQMYPKDEQSSLKYFLAKYKLGGKEDMPISRLFDIYRRYRKFMININYEEQIKDKNKILNPDIPENLKESFKKHAEEFAEVLYYCVVDSQRVFELLSIASVFMDRRELSNMAYTSFQDAIYRANGVKVRNLTIAIGQKWPFNIRFSNRYSGDDREEGKYPGAYVFKPIKGLKVSKLSIKERIEKLNYYESNPKRQEQNKYKDWENTTDKELEIYYNIIEKYGPNQTAEEITNIEKNENTKLPSKFKDFLLEPTGRPVAGLDFSSLYPSLIRTYNFSPEMCIKNNSKLLEETRANGTKLTEVDFMFQNKRRIAHFIHHENNLDPNKPGFKFGLFPYILDDLFKRRKQIKKQLEYFKDNMEIIKNIISKKRLSCVKESYEHLIKEIFKFNADINKIMDIFKPFIDNPDSEISNDAICALQERYEEMSFDYNYLNAKQAAVKVFMNTFYGEAGSKASPFFVLEVAGGVTSYGKKSILKAKDWVLSQKCKIYYGDTDSLYISMPEPIFEEIDKKYYTDRMRKLDYWYALVELSFKKIADIQNFVNKNFKDDTSSEFLQMAYEEFLFVIFLGASKKYFGMQHIKLIDFTLKMANIFIRGFEIIKRGASEFLKREFGRIMLEMCDPNNTKEVMELVLDCIDNIYKNAKNIDLKDFVRTDVFRPNKKNVRIQTFAKRMAALGKPISPGERFSYVYVKKYPYNYDERGRKVEISAGDKMELVDEAIKNGYDIDLDYYMKGSINGQLARLVAYHDLFKVEPLDDTEEEIKKADKKVYANACKFIDDYCSQYYSHYNDVGTIFKKAYRIANKYLSNELITYDKKLTTLLTANIEDNNIMLWLFGEQANGIQPEELNYYTFGNKLGENNGNNDSGDGDNDDNNDDNNNGGDNDNDNDYADDTEWYLTPNKEERKSKMKEYKKAEAKANKDIGYVEKQANKLTKEYGKRYVDEQVKIYCDYMISQYKGEIDDKEKKALYNKYKKEKINNMQKIYYGLLNTKGCKLQNIKEHQEKIFNQNVKDLIDEYRNKYQKINSLYNFHNNKITEMLDNIKDDIKIPDSIYKPLTGTSSNPDTELELNEDKLNIKVLEEKSANYYNEFISNEDYKQSAKEFKDLYLRILATYVNIKKTRDIVHYLKNKRDKDVSYVVAPPNLKAVIRKDTEELIRRIDLEGIKL